MNESRYERALIRNLHETGASIFDRKALIGIESAKSYHAWDFFRVVYYALFNDMVAHCMRVFDRNSQSASFWYIYRCQQSEIDSYVKSEGLDFSCIERVADRLKHVRDKTHFHIDREAVKDPSSVWQQADIKGTELASAADAVWQILNHLHRTHFDKAFDAPSYDGTDATRIIQAAQAAGIVPA